MRLGLSAKPATSVMVSERALRRFEFTATRGLATAGMMDTLLAGLATAVDSPGEGPYTDSGGANATQTLLSALSDCVQHTADHLATLYFNVVLLRRDRLLESSALPHTARAAARSVPVAQPWLFGSAAGQVVTEAAAHASSALALRASMSAVSRSAARSRRPPPRGAPPRKVPRTSAPLRPQARPHSAPRPPVRPPQRRYRPAVSVRGRAPHKGQHPQ